MIRNARFHGPAAADEPRALEVLILQDFLEV